MTYTLNDLNLNPLTLTLFGEILAGAVGDTDFVQTTPQPGSDWLSWNIDDTFDAMAEALLVLEEEYVLNESDAGNRIWVGSEASYNAGRLIGTWVSLPMPEDVLNAVISVLTCNGRWDYGLFANESDSDLAEALMKEHWSNAQKINDLLEEYGGLDEVEQATLAFLMEYFGYTLDEAVHKIDDVCVYPDWDEILYHHIDEVLLANVRDRDTRAIISCYIDHQKLKRDLKTDGVVEYGGFIFEYYG